MRCDQCQPQLLHYVYEVLDADEQAMVAAHVERCPACREALKAAQEQAGLLAEAVKESAGELVFKAPQNAESLATARTVAMPPRPRRPLFFINRWSIAAAVLLAIFTGGGVIGWSIYRENQDNLERAQAQLASAREQFAQIQRDSESTKGQSQKDIRAIQAQIDQLFRDWRGEEAKKRKLEKDRVQAILNGPQAAQAGAPNHYQIQMFKTDAESSSIAAPPSNVHRQPASLPNQKVHVRVVDDKNTALFTQDLVTQKDGSAQFVLPSNVPFKPGHDVRLILETPMPDGTVVQVGESLKLDFPEYVTHLATDRPLYRPGETVRFRSLTLERFSLKPAQQALSLRYRIVGPRRNEIYRQDAVSKVHSDTNEAINSAQGVGVGEFKLPANLPGGKYTLLVSELNDRFTEQKRTFSVQERQASRLNKEVQFHRSSYGPGDSVRVQIKVTPTGGAAPAGIQVVARVNVDDLNIDVNNPQNRYVDSSGIVAFNFNLPAQLHKGVGTVSFTCNDNGNEETTQRTIPIFVNNLNVDFYPEGGDLIAGGVNRVYFQATTPAGKPADFEATVFDDKNQRIAAIKTLTDEAEPGINQGLGSFSFTPLSGRRYRAVIDSPIGIDRPFPLPAVKENGITLTCAQPVAEDAIGVTVRSARQARELLIGAYCRGKMLDYQQVKASVDQPMEVALKPEVNVGGVYRITAFEKLNIKGTAVYRPLAERLVYRKQAARVDVVAEPSKNFYLPGEKVALGLRAFNEKHEPAAAYAMVAVVDQSLLKWADEKTYRAMPTHFLLTSEVNNPEDLENADVLLGPHPKAAQALDLLLGCQGWRRFAEQDPTLFQRRMQQTNAPTFIAGCTPVLQRVDIEQSAIEKLDEVFVSKAIALEKSLAVQERQENVFAGDAQRLATAQTMVGSAEQAADQARERLREVRIFFVQFGMGGALLLLLFVGFFLVSVGLRRLAEGEPARLWLIAGLTLLCCLFVASVVGTFLFMGEQLMVNVRPGGGRFGVAKSATTNSTVVMNDDVALLMPIEVPIREETLDEQAAPMLPAAKGPMSKKGAYRPQVPAAVMPHVNDGNPGNAPRQVPAAEEGDRELRQQGKFQTILQRRLGRRVPLPAASDPGIVREYAHRHPPAKNDAQRDFAETLYWHPILPLTDGKASIAFEMSDSVTRFDVLVLSHTADGRLGANRIEIASKLPFSIEPKTPLEIASSDRLVIPVTLANALAAPAEATLSLRARGLRSEDNAERGIKLMPNETRRERFEVRPSIVEGTAVVRVAARKLSGADAVERRIKVMPDGFPVSGSINGVLETAPMEATITLPSDWVEGSLKLQAQLYPSPIAELQSGLEALLREPGACFEQCVSDNYPNVLTLSYMKTAGQFNANFQPSPLVEKRARGLLQSGYRQLASFECPAPGQPAARQGFEWFGGPASPDSALTAYGLLHLGDMAKVYPVDEAMRKRTEDFLLQQRDGNGGFQRSPKGLDRSGRAPDAVANAYVVWALTESGTKANLDTELTAIRSSAQKSGDAYVLALAGLSHLNRGKAPDAGQLLRNLATRQRAEGQVAGAATSITGSQGRDLAIETTALALLGWIRSDMPAEFNPNITLGVQWLNQQRQAGGFGSTQATILALKALVAHAQKHPRLNQGGDITLTVRDLRNPALPGAAPGMRFGPGGAMASVLPEANRAFYSSRSQDTITIDLADTTTLRPGNNVIELRSSTPGSLPYTINWSCRTRQPANAPAAPVRLTTSLSQELAKEGDTVKLKARVENVTGKAQGMTVAIVGLPAGLALPTDFEQLKAYARAQEGGAKAGKIAAWELRGRDLVLYWRDLAADAKIDVELNLHCRLPGYYSGPASRAYLYYDSDQKYWATPLTIRIEPAG